MKTSNWYLMHCAKGGDVGGVVGDWREGGDGEGRNGGEGEGRRGGWKGGGAGEGWKGQKTKDSESQTGTDSGSDTLFN